MPRARKYLEELLERATRLVFESGRPIAHVARDLGLPPETLRLYVRSVEANEGRRKDLLSDSEYAGLPGLRAILEEPFDQLHTEPTGDRRLYERQQRDGKNPSRSAF
jgi:transposase